jgi:hypothetical protein
MNYSFAEKLLWSKGQSQQDDLATLRAMISGAVSVEPTTEREDRNGNDYAATLRHGAVILIDVKSRTPGCSRFWNR